ncbi:MAG: hypothetical protein WC570_00915 [Patescibacteria group bacterium]
MKKEGWKYIVALASLVVMFVGGLFLVRPFPWLLAQEVKLEGQVTVNDQNYDFTGERALVIDNIRHIRGFAQSESGGKIFFDTSGAEVKVDQLGYWYGNLMTEEYGLIELGLELNRKVQIGETGQLNGSFVIDDNKFSWQGQTSWQPYELAEIQVAETMKVDVGSKSMIDPKILGLGGRDLYDAQVVFESKNDQVTVDEYGYVEVKKEGTYKNVVVVTVGGEQKAITLQATERVTDVTVTPKVVVRDTNPSLTIEVEPASLVGEVKAVALVKGVDELIACLPKPINISVINTATGTIEVNCNLAGEGTGSWNLVLQMESGEEYVFTDKLNILDSENPLNLTMITKVEKPNSEGTGYVDSEGMTVLTGYRVSYKVLVDLPSFLEESEINGGEYTVIFNGRGPSTRCATDKKTDPILLKGNFVPNADNEVDLGSVVYTGTMPQGCDLVAKLSLSDVKFDNGLAGIGGTAEASNAIKSAKQVLLRGDVLVQEGDLKVEALHESSNMFTLVAGDNVDVSVGATGEGNVSDYDVSGDAQFDQVLSQIEENIRKLVIERAVPSSGALDDIENELKIFTAEQKSKNPEGRIIYNNDPVGPLLLGEGGDTWVCGPVTLVIEGRDVVVQNNIVKAPMQYPCSEEGNFGLIVIGGDIKFSGDVTQVEGYYFTTGTLYTGESHNKFTLRGVSIAHDYVLQRY